VSKWEVVKLGEIFKITSGGTPSKNNPDYYTNGTIPWVRTGDLKNKYIKKVDVLITEEALSKSSAKLFPAGTVLIAMYGATIGACSILSIDASTNQACAAFLPNEKVDSSYLYYFLCSKKNDFIKMGVGGAQPNISATILKGVDMPLPPLETQKQIAKTLDTAAELLAMRKQQLAELNNLIKSIFYDMFGSESDFNRWECTTIENVAKVTVGVVIKPAQYYTQGPNGVKAFRSLNVGEMYVREESWVYFTPEGHLVHNKSVLKTGDVLIVRSGAPGTSCVVSEKYAGCNAIDIIIARPDINKIKPLYLCAFTNFPHGKNQIKMKTGGAAQQHINVGAYKAMTIPLPPLELQTQFADIVTKIEEQKALVKKAIDETQYLFDSLMSQYFE